MNKIELRQIIKEKSWKKKWIAGHLGIDPSLITKMLSGERSITIKHANKINELIRKNIGNEPMEIMRNVHIDSKLHKEMKEFCNKRNLKIGGWVNSIIRHAIRRTIMLENIGKADKHFELVESEEVLPEDLTDVRNRFEK